MTEHTRGNTLALLRRELQEYKNSLVLTPMIVAGVFVLLLLVSMLLTNSLTIVGSSMVEILENQSASHGVNITISLDEEQPAPDYIVEEEFAGEEDAREWNFGRDWTFNPQPREQGQLDATGGSKPVNTVLNGLHWFFLLILLGTSINYLLGALYHDRRDGSILFWKSMPVAEKQEIGAKLMAACLLAPAIYLLASLFTQLCSVLIASLAVWRMDMNPAEVVMANLDIPGLLGAQLGGMVVWILWTLPLYAWLLLCSAAAKRSPLLLAVAIPLALVVLEQLFLGSDYLSSAITAHFPQRSSAESNSLGFYFSVPDWGALDYAGMLAGLLVAAIFLFGASRLRKYRLEV
jgi:hypothetical protein